MPWCDDCSRFYNPNSLPESGVCPGCGRTLMKPAKLRRAQQGRGGGADALAAASATAASTAAEGGDDPAGDAAVDPDKAHTPVPWHFWILVVALVIYLGWRLVQLAMWLAK